MDRTQTPLPHLTDRLFIADGGLETTLTFHDGIELPEFAAYDLLRTQRGREQLLNYYRGYADLARRHEVGILLDTPTWRANPDWGKRLGDSAETLDQLNRESVDLIARIRAEYASESTAVIISGCVGPRGDGYEPSRRMSVEEARDYHSTQIASLASAGVDMITALTFNYIEEAIGVTLATRQHGLPVCISFTVETDGRLPTGDSLGSAIEAVDQATDGGPSYYQLNCAHTTHFDHVLYDDEPWIQRIQGIRGNASCLSHAELDESEVLDEGDPTEFGQQYREILDRMPHVNVLGGCCGTDQRHIEQVCLSCLH